MGWSTDLFCNISYNRKTYNNKYEVEQDYADISDQLKTAESSLRDLVMMTEPYKFFNDEDGDMFDIIQTKFNETLSLFKELHEEKMLLEFLIDNWDVCHTKEGLAIAPPEGIGWGKAFLDGDFIKSTRNKEDFNE